MGGLRKRLGVELVTMVGVAGFGGFARTAPTGQSCLMAALTSASVPFGPFRGCIPAGCISVAVEQFLPFSGCALGASGTSVETAPAVSAARTRGITDVEQPALPSDAVVQTGGGSTWRETATSSSASHGGRTVASAAVRQSGHRVAVRAQHARC